ncbi:MAG: DUF4392 domain-containing protein [Halioglobus sp.]|nr:DUF4392 domain-containing protein [Halioglobus sp.]
MDELQLSYAMEQLLVARNLRYMKIASAALKPGYFLRGARLLRDLKGPVIIATGFPVADSFETDGPVGAIALYRALHLLGAKPIIACGPPLSRVLANDYNVVEFSAWDLHAGRAKATTLLSKIQPQAVVSIELPGIAADGLYYNMHSEDITPHCPFFDPFISQANCPTIAIGDGGNEIGMGNITVALQEIDIRPSVTRCDELLVADVSNWGAYGLIAWLAFWAGRDLLGDVSPLQLLDYLCACGSVDGVTGENTPTEDGLDATEGLRVIAQLRALTNFTHD